jgi:hypothetical protein
VKIGEGSRGGLPRGAHRACAHEVGLQEKDLPGGLVDEETAQLPRTLGSADKTRAFIVDALESWWAAWAETEPVAMARRQINRDNGPESRGRRTQFLNRLVDVCDRLGTPMHLLDYPPYHSKSHPIERCWGLLELPGNGTTLVEVATLLAWANRMTWKGRRPLVELSQTGDQKGGTVGTKAMRAVEARLERHLELPTWDMLIRPASTS